MKWWHMGLLETEKALQTNRNTGLSAEQAAKRLAEQGKNRLIQESGRGAFLKRFLAQFNDFMVLLLLGAAAVSFAVSYWNGENDFVDSAIIIGIVVLNSLLGVIQESRAEKALEALKELSAPKARVLRGGKEREIPAEDVVPGDILLLHAGDYICADGRILENHGMKTEESAITGESLAAEKEDGRLLPEETALGDRKNMLLSGSYLLSGTGKAIVTATGMDTEIGRIAALLAEQEESGTPLQKKLGETGKALGIGALGICGVIFAMGLLRHEAPFAMFMTSVSLAVAAIPEGLPAIVTIVLAIGMQRMSKRNTIIRRLPAVETLGGAEVICSDKTGTLTQNRMKVVKLAGLGRPLERDLEKRKFLLTLFALCSDARREGKRILGEPTEKALAEAAEEAGLSLSELRQEMPRRGEIPFSSERKLMTTLHKAPGGNWISITKGAPDILLERCSRCLDGAGQAAFSGGRKSTARMINGEMAANALRVVAAAFREWDTEPALTPEELEQDLVFAGMAGMIDPPREEAETAVAVCKRAGIRPVMITGDHALTAQAIASKLGIYRKGDRCITGQELDRLSDEELETAAERCTVFARVAPEHKVRIVKAFQSGGHIVAMTGDGVNDAPALKAADIGCAMGKNGTEVAKGAADMILTDDNFATIVEAVREGRGIYDNIRKAVHFLLSSNIGEIITIFAAMCFGWAAPLLPIQLLWVNLVTDSLPAIALGLEPAEKDVMERPPRTQEATLFSGGLGSRIAVEGMMIGMLALLAFGVGHVYFDREQGYAAGRTMAFAVLSLSQLVHAFNMRTEHSLFSIPLLGNPFLIGAFFAGVLLQAGVIMSAPLAAIFKVCPLSAEQWLIVAGLSLAPLPVVELEKWKDRRGSMQKAAAEERA